MRQSVARQAALTDPRSGHRESVAAFLHQVSDHVNGGLEAALRHTELGESCDTGAGSDDLPRLISVSFEAPSVVA